MPGYRMALAASLVGLFLLLPGCGGDDAGPAPGASGGESTGADGGGTPPAARPTTLEELALYNGADWEEILTEGARKEGTVVWYTSLAGDVIDALAKGFNDKYGVPVDIFRAPTKDLLARVLEEAQTGRSRVDVLEATTPTGLILLDQGLLQPYWVPDLAGLPEGAIRSAEGGAIYWMTDRESYIGFAANTDRLPASALPVTYDDLMKPELKGHMAIAGSDTGMRMIGNLATHKGEEFVQRLKGQEIVIQQVSGKALSDLIVSGEVWASPTIFRDHAEQSAQQGAPIVWKPLEPVTTNAGIVQILKGAPHAHAAVLLARFLLAEDDGQRILAEHHYGGAKGDPGFERWYPETGLTGSGYDEKQRGWNDLMRSIGRAQ